MFENRKVLPFITAHLPGIKGEIKAKPQYFKVDEVPLYEAEGKGEHIYVRIKRKGWNTWDLQRSLAHIFQIRECDIGFAGLKDKNAEVSQTFSLWLPHTTEEEVEKKIRSSLPVHVLWVKRHRNKIKTGHLLGNYFEILVTNPDKNAIENSHLISSYLEEHGFPNYFGLQRFGLRGENASLGYKILTKRKKRYHPWLHRFLISAYQSALFNEWLAVRIERGKFETLLVGDIAKKTDTGGMFEVQDLEKELPRFQRKEITYTGPIYGKRMPSPKGEEEALEKEILQKGEASLEIFCNAKVQGNRRAARLFLQNLKITPSSEGIWFSFFLSKGAYATMALREFLKQDFTLEENDGVEEVPES